MNYKVAVQKIPRGYFEMHPSEAAIIVKYQVHAVVLRVDGTEAASGKKDATKLIRFANLAEATDLKRVARDTLSKCQYLDPSRQEELEQVLVAIHNRQKIATPSRPGTAMRPLTAAPVRRSKTEAKISDLAQYRTLLYNSVEEKILGSEMILQLCQKKTYLPQILRSDPVLNSLSRILFEEETRNLDLKINATRIFAALSELSAAPAVLTKNRIGATLLQEINIEQQRYQKWKEELTLRQSGNKAEPSDVDALRRKLVMLIRKQDLFISAGLQILLVLARDIGTQTKMVKKDILTILSKCCERTNSDLQTASLEFLLMLSVYGENMERFVQAGTVEKLVRLLDHQRSSNVCQLVLKLCFNLSLCPSLRKVMLKKNLAKKLATHLQDPETCELTAQVLYSLSSERRSRRDLASPELIGAMAREITRTAESNPSPNLMALALNLLTSASAVSDFVKSANVDALLQCAIQKEDALLLHIIKAVIDHSAPEALHFGKKLLPLVEKVKESQGTPVTLVAFLVLASSLDSGALTPEELLASYNVDLELISRCQTFHTPHELIALIVFMGALASHTKTVKILTDTTMSDWLCQKLGEVDEEELTLQMGYALMKFVQYEPARRRVMEYPGITKILSERAQQSSDVTRALFEELLFHLSSTSEEIHEAWKMERFQQYNSQWLRAVQNRREEGGDGNLCLDDFNDDELDLVTRFGLNDLCDEMEEEEEDVEDMIERYSARSQSRLSLR